MKGFFALHSGLTREGPGSAQDVAWAVGSAVTPRTGRICDAGCGPGADIPALRDAVPDGHVTALDTHLPFLTEAATRGHGRGVRLVEGALIAGDTGLPDPVTLGPFDLIWCAGAAYFEGVTAVLTHWRHALSPGGAVAFSYPAYFQPPTDAARAFWGGDADVVLSEDALDDEIRAAGWGIVARSRVGDAGWHAYYSSLEERCSAVQDIQSTELKLAIEESRAEAAAWRAAKDVTGYALRVVRPVDG